MEKTIVIAEELGQGARGSKVRKGLVMVHTGDGKGKTTAALGVLFRAWGQDVPVRMFQFIKNTGAQFGEHRAAAKIGLAIEALGDGCTTKSKDIGQSRALALEQWSICKEALLAGGVDIVILDEFTYPLHFGWIAVDEVVDTLRRRPPLMHVVITGRHAPQALIDYADIVSETRSVKHSYHDIGLTAQPGIEY